MQNTVAYVYSFLSLSETSIDGSPTEFLYYNILWQIMGTICHVMLYRFLSPRIKVFFSPQTWLFGKVVLGIMGGIQEGPLELFGNTEFNELISCFPILISSPKVVIQGADYSKGICRSPSMTKKPSMLNLCFPNSSQWPRHLVVFFHPYIHSSILFLHSYIVHWLLLYVGSFGGFWRHLNEFNRPPTLDI